MECNGKTAANSVLNASFSQTIDQSIEFFEEVRNRSLPLPECCDTLKDSSSAGVSEYPCIFLLPVNRIGKVNQDNSVVRDRLFSVTLVSPVALKRTGKAIATQIAGTTQIQRLSHPETPAGLPGTPYAQPDT
jgi:hypothetical protein